MKKLALTAALAVSLGLSQAAQAHPTHSGYLTDHGDSNISTGFGGCWKIGNWNTDKGSSTCGDKAAPAPVAKAEAPAPAPAKPAAPTYVLKSTERSHIVYFDFNSSKVSDVSEIVDTVSSLSALDSISLVGHTDKIGQSGDNDVLAQKRVNAVASALQAAGVDASKIRTGARGEDAPVKTCDGSGQALRDCLGANRRVEVTINGQVRVAQQ